jgi:hypothetical protein
MVLHGLLLHYYPQHILRVLLYYTVHIRTFLLPHQEFDNNGMVAQQLLVFDEYLHVLYALLWLDCERWPPLAIGRWRSDLGVGRPPAPPAAKILPAM